MGRYRTAQGKILDMSALAAQNEKTRAVGNMKVNARGDTIDDSGKVVVSVTQKVGEKYQKTVGNKSAQIKKPTPQQPAQKPQQVKEAVELTDEEKELEADFDEDIENQIQKLKEQETKK